MHFFDSSHFAIKKNVTWVLIFHYIKCKQAKFNYFHILDQSCVSICCTCFLFMGLKRVKLFSIFGRTKIQRCIPRCWFISRHWALVWCMWYPIPLFGEALFILLFKLFDVVFLMGNREKSTLWHTIKRGVRYMHYSKIKRSRMTS